MIVNTGQLTRWNIWTLYSRVAYLKNKQLYTVIFPLYDKARQSQKAYV